MQYHWLNKKNNDNLIIFFAGWSFDQKPFEFLDCGDYDVLMFYNYNDMSLPFDLNDLKYQKITLISWSFGVLTANLLKDKLPQFVKKIAINGTTYPVNNDFGIPEKTFNLTLKHVHNGLAGKFYENVFANADEYEHYLKSPIERAIEDRAEELYALAELKGTEPFYDFAIVGDSDKIIPTKNQINFWQNFGCDYKLIASGHFPFYNFNSWEEILSCK